MSLIPTMPLTYSYSYRVKDNASIKDRVNDMSVLRAKYMNPASDVLKTSLQYGIGGAELGTLGSLWSEKLR